jgi:hypothetical protein
MGIGRRVRAIVLVEVSGFRVFLGGAWWMPFAVVATIVAAFSLLRLGIQDIYSESVPFLVLAIAAGLVSRTTGMLLVLGHTIADLLREALAPSFGLELLVGRLTAAALLWILVVTVPLAARWLEAALSVQLSGGRASRPYLRVPVSGSVSAAVLGLLVAAWSQGAAYLIRPAFPSSPTVEAIAPLQNDAILLGVIAAAMSLALSLLLRPRVGRDADVVPILPPVPNGTLAGFLARAIRALVVLVLLRGVISGLTDIALLGSALLGAELIVWWLAHRPTVSPIRPIPVAWRLLLASALTFLVTAVVTTLAYERRFGSEFFPLVLSIAVGFLAFRILLAPGVWASREGIAPPAGHVVIAVTAAVGWLFLVPAEASADNCSSLIDCARDAGAAIWTGVTFVAGIAWGVALGVFDKTPPVISHVAPLASEEGAQAQQGAFNAFQKKKALERLADGDFDGYRRTMDQSTGEFYRETTGKR